MWLRGLGPGEANRAEEIQQGLLLSATCHLML